MSNLTDYEKQAIFACYKTFQAEGLWSKDPEVLKKNFKLWAVKNHPDKNPLNGTKFRDITSCRDTLVSFIVSAMEYRARLHSKRVQKASRERKNASRRSPKQKTKA